MSLGDVRKLKDVVGMLLAQQEAEARGLPLARRPPAPLLAARALLVAAAATS